MGAIVAVCGSSMQARSGTVRLDARPQVNLEGTCANFQIEPIRAMCKDRKVDGEPQALPLVERGPTAYRNRVGA